MLNKTIILVLKNATAPTINFYDGNKINYSKQTVKKKFPVYSHAGEMKKSREKYFSNGDSPPVTWQYFVGRILLDNHRQIVILPFEPPSARSGQRE